MWRINDRQLEVGDRVCFKRDAVIFDDDLKDMDMTLGHEDPEYVWSGRITGFNGSSTVIVDLGYDVVVFVEIEEVWKSYVEYNNE
ncbi:MAG: hypothetical protein MJZ20_07045 [Bacteroidaceae bacterium]|nr:hypothetical protein [Bacteroidaceae bacterium]